MSDGTKDIIRWILAIGEVFLWFATGGLLLYIRLICKWLEDDI